MWEFTRWLLINVIPLLGALLLALGCTVLALILRAYVVETMRLPPGADLATLADTLPSRTHPLAQRDALPVTSGPVLVFKTEEKK